MMTPRRRLFWLAMVVALTATGIAVTATAQQSGLRYAIVARGDVAADALAAAPLGGRLDAPVVLTEPTVLSDAARDALVAAAPDVVLIAGGTGAISADVAEAIRTLLPVARVDRFAGDTRYDTAALLAAQFGILPPAFLPQDGTAQRAETADHATTADTADTAVTADAATTFGGLPAESFSRVWSERSRAVATGRTLGPDSVDRTYALDVDVPADGFLLVTGMVSLVPTAGGVDDQAFNLTALLAMDAPTDLTDGAALSAAVFGSAGVSTTRRSEGVYEPSGGSVTISGVVEVAAGVHTLEILVGSGFGDPNDEFTALGRSLSAVFIPHGQAVTTP